MSTALEKITKIASKESSNWLNEAKERQDRRTWSELSFKIAMRILREIRKQKEINGMTQKKLTESMNVSPQYINKVIKGKENLTLETISKIEQVLGIALIEVPSFDCSDEIRIETTKTKSSLKRTQSISIGIAEWQYNNNSYLTASPTNA